MRNLVFGVLLLQAFIPLGARAQDFVSESPLTFPTSTQPSGYTVYSGSTVLINSGSSVTLLPGVHLQAGSNVTIQVGLGGETPATPASRNWVTSRSYDEDGNLTGESKAFYGYDGKGTQTQVKSLSNGKIIATETLYDIEGRAAVNTLPAPIAVQDFQYQANFVTTSSGTNYSYRNFEDGTGITLVHGGKTDSPDPVGNSIAGTLGWYYSDNNTLEPYVPTTSYPYSRAVFYSDGSGAVKATAGPGDELRMGKRRESRSYSFPVVSELAHYKNVRDKLFPETVVGEGNALGSRAVHTVSVDVNGQQAVSITDLSGKVLMSALPGSASDLKVDNSVTISKQPGYEFGFNGGEIGEYANNLKVEGGSVKVYEKPAGATTFSLIYNGAASTYTSASNLYGWYRIESEDYFTVSYDAVNSSGVSSVVCDDCSAKIMPQSKQQALYLGLLQSGTITVSPYTGVTVYNMKSEGPIIGGSITPIGGTPGSFSKSEGYYKIITGSNTPQGDIVVTYTNYYKDISYSFYNQLGQLIATIAPEGVKELLTNGIDGYSTAASVPFITLYEYDLRGRLIELTEPDAGRTEYVYRKDGSIRFSQNAKQRNNGGSYSYTNYDRWGRTVESGEYVPGSTGISFATAQTDGTLQENTFSDGGLGTGTKRDWVRTNYDEPSKSHAQAGYVQDESFLRGAVSWTENANSSTWYNYDGQGRVTWVVKKINGLGTKTVDYSYDSRGNTIKVDYQKNASSERFVHEYEYDADSRLSAVYTAAGTSDRMLQAKYIYYLHGPLKRVELADQLQGIDYAYTPQGWLKAINHPAQATDPGKDGSTGSSFAPDVFGMTLEYFNGDYIRANTGIGSLSAGSVREYFNGNIKAQSWRSTKPTVVSNTHGAGVNNPVMQTYEYDDKYQFLGNRQGVPDFSANTFTETANVNREYGLSYNANGNIKSLQRTNASGSPLDNFTTYTYTEKTNKLASVGDGTSEFATYIYDELGQMTTELKSAANGGNYYLNYDVSGKVIGIYSDAGKTKLKVSYAYDETGRRIKKTTYLATSSYDTYYVYDASGNTLAIYDNNGSTLQQKEVPVYASGRIGVYSKPGDSYQYELADHLGNVRAVLSRTKVDGKADVAYYSDYYPFGSPLTLQAGNGYRYGYQGQYAEKDQETGWNSFELRMYNSRTGRWMSTDPYGQFASPYVGMGNNPVSGVDPDGGYSWFGAAWRYAAASVSGTAAGGGIYKSNNEWGFNEADASGGWSFDYGRAQRDADFFATNINVTRARKFNFGDAQTASFPLASGAVHSNFDDLGEQLAYAYAGAAVGRLVGLGLNYARPSNYVYRSLTAADAASLRAGNGLLAKAPNGAWSLEQHLIQGSSSKAWLNNPWIATSTDINIARSFLSGNGLVRINLSKLPAGSVHRGWMSLPRSSAAYHYSIWQQEVSVFQSIPQNAIKVIY